MTKQERKAGIYESARLAFKSVMHWSGFGGEKVGVTNGGSFNMGRIRRFLPGASYDYEAKAGPLWQNSAVAIALAWISHNFTQPRLTVQVRKGDEWIDNPEHRILEALETPNSGYDDDVLWAATILSLKTDGNAYWLKARARNGRVEYWYLRHWEVKPTWPTDGSTYIDGYVHSVDGKQTQLAVEDVIHFREGIDPDNERLGWAALKTCFREVCSDNEANNYVATILRNMGVTSVVISPDSKDDTIDADDRKDIAKSWKEKTTGEERGSAMVFSVPMKIAEVGTSPENMALDKIRQIPEARIFGALGVDPMVAGVSVGTGTRTFSNLKEANRHSYENCLMPLQKAVVKAIQRQSPEIIGNRRVERLTWDYTEVSALREDQSELTKRTVMSYQGGIMTKNEARSRVGLGPVPGGDKCLYKPTVVGDLPQMGDEKVKGEAA